MSQIRCVSTRKGDQVTTALYVPAEVLDRLNNAEDILGEQEGATMRDRTLQVLAAMVIQSIDEFRQGDLFRYPPIDGNAATLIEGSKNGDDN